MRKNMCNRIISNLLALSMIVTMVFCAPTALATVSALGNVTAAVVNGNELQLTIDNGSDSEDDILILEVCQGNILRVNYRPNSVSESPNTPMIDPDLTWDEVNATIDTSSNPISIVTSDMRIEIAKFPCRMTVKKADGTTLFWEPESGGVFHDGVRFVRAESTNMYGIHGFDCFSDNGNLLRNNNTRSAAAGQQGDSGGPFMWSSGGYGILIDADGGYPYTNSADKKMEYYYGDTIAEGRRYFKDDVEYYILLGDPKEIMKGYAKITGTSPMMPKWSIGFSNFEWDIDESELNEMIDLYRAKNIPIDSYAIDYDWKQYGQDNYGEFTWNTENFPSASTTSLKTTLEAKGIKLIGITKPRIVTRLENGTVTAQGQAAATNNYFYPGHSDYIDYFLPVTVRSIDFYDEEEREWWWEHSEGAFDKGIVGWWNDETDKVSSNGADYWFGNFETLGISQAMYEGQRNYTNNNTRVWQTARNYYPGTQRYATSIWSGDVATQFYKGERVTWAAGLNEQKAAMLSTINNGQVKWGSDGGGFNQNSGNIENPSPELYARWLQFASVTPVFRVHGTNHQQRQPWYFGLTAEEITKAVIHQRYSLIPYIYSYEREAHDTGLGLVRPLLFDYPSDANVANYSDAWMFGDWLLAAPITERGQSVKWIYLPAGTWIDFNRGTQYTGGRYVPYAINSTSWTDLPLFIKEGAIIPSQDVMNYVDEENVTQIYVDVFPASNETAFRFYDDDGKSYNYEETAFHEQIITAEKNNDTTAINITAKSGSYNAGLNFFYLRVHGQAATTVKDGSTSLTKYTDYNALLSTPGEGWATGRDVYGAVTYVKVSAGDVTALTLSGSTTIQDEHITYEAERASLSGSTVALKASVNNNHTGYSGSGFIDNLEADDAAVTFYSKVANAGQYDVLIRCANGNTAVRTLSVYVNGSYEGQLSVPTTGDWDTWDSVVHQMNLSAGNNIITLKYDTAAGDTGHINIDYISVPFDPVVILVEAEESALYGSAKTNQDHWLYSGSGFVDTLTSNGDGVEFYVNMNQGGNRSISLRYANGTQSTKTLNLYVNGTFVSPVHLTSDGANWNLWKEHQSTVSLTKGLNTIAYKYETGNTGNVNLDRLSVNMTGTAKAPLVDNGGFERSNYSSAWTEWHPDGQDCVYGVDSGSGINPPESPMGGDRRAYFYSSNAYQQSIHQEISAPNGIYQVWAWVRVSNTTPLIGRMEVAGYGGESIFVNMPASGIGWALVSVDNVMISTGFLDIGFYCSSSGGTTVHIDGVDLVQKPVPS